MRKFRFLAGTTLCLTVLSMLPACSLSLARQDDRPLQFSPGFAFSEIDTDAVIFTFNMPLTPTTTQLPDPESR